jgi:very-short-patch-repair endonuclease
VKQGSNREDDAYLEFENAYDAFIKFHAKRRSGQEAERIKLGLKHAEKMFVETVWWAAFHNFNALHPEYEIRDFKDGHRYIDFVYLQPHFRIAIEIDGIGPHWKDISQEQFCDHCQRQNHLVIDGWHVLRFAYKDVHEHPRLCQQTIQQLIGRLTGDSSGMLQAMNVTDREIFRLALGLPRPITVQDVVTHIRLRAHAAASHLKRLTEAGWLEPASGSLRIHSYRIHPSRTNIQL